MSQRKRTTQGSKTKKKTPAKKRSGASKSGKGRRAKKKRSLLWRIVTIGFFVTLAATALGAGMIAILFAHWSDDLPELFSADDYRPKQVSRIYDRNGNVLLELYDERRTVIPIEEIPEAMRYAMIAAEDAKFYEHKGLDYIGVLRAAYTNVQRGGFSQGASTITQQVVKNLLLTPEKEIKRKVQEVLLARRLEEVLSKDEILWIYLNHIYFGHRNYGIEEASKFYFDKHARALSLNEAATLAGIVQSPERLSPVKHMEKCIERRNYVLRQMRDSGFITEDVFRSTVELPIEVAHHAPPSLGKARHFVEKVRRDLIDEYGKDYLYTAGLEIHTTVDLRLQAMSDAALQQGLHEFDERQGYYRPVTKAGASPASLEGSAVYTARVTAVTGDDVRVAVGEWDAPLVIRLPDRVVPEGATVESVFATGSLWRVRPVSGTIGPNVKFELDPGPDGAFVVIEPRTREVLAVSGGYDYEHSSFNRALQAHRQIGSSFKPIVFAAGLEAKVIAPATVIDDAPKVFHIPGKDEPWSPRNFDSKFKGPMTTRIALAKSRNTVAVDVLERVGIERATSFARRIGIRSDLVGNFTMALGSTELTALESANAFATFASGGYLAEPVFVTRIERRGGEVLYESQPEPKRVVSEELAFLITSMMRSVATEGTAARHLADWNHFAVGKTGTTNGPKDAWFIGYTDYFVGAAYVGFDQPKKLGRKEGGSKTALPIWAGFMKAAHDDLEPRDFAVPAGVLEARIDPVTGKLAPPEMKRTRTEYFLPGTVPTEMATTESDDVDFTMRQLGRAAEPSEVGGAEAAPPTGADTADPAAHDPGGF